MTVSKPIIQKETLTRQVVDLITRRILRGELKSGQRIWAADLAKEFGVSMIPVKEALLILQGEGLITNISRRGSVVRRFTSQDVHELIMVRELIETHAAAQAIAGGCVDEKLLRDLKRHNEAIGAARNNEGGFKKQASAYEHDRRFHDVFVEACGNKLLMEWYQRLNTQAQIIRFAFWNISLRGDKTYNEHNAIIKGISGRNSEAAQEAIKAHLASIALDFDRAVEDDKEALGILQEGENSLPHGRRRLKNKS